MAKNKAILIAFISVFVVLALFSSFYFTQQSLFYDDYLLEDDFSQPSPALAHNPSNCVTIPNQQIRECTDTKWYILENTADNYGRSGLISATGEGLVLTAQGEQKPSLAKYLLNEKNREMKVKIKSDVGANKGSGSGGFTIFLNNEVAYQYSESWGVEGGQIINDFSIEIQINPEKENNYGVFVNGEKANEITLTEKEVYFKIKADSQGELSKTIIKLSYLKSKPFYSCRVDSDEVAVKTVFTEGTFSYKDLQPQPKQLCPLEYPIVKRSLTEKGSKNVASLFTTLQTGGSITVNKGELYEVSYVVDYKEGMGEKCQIDQALNLKTKKCEKVITEEPDVIEVINQQLLVPVGNNQIYYTNDITIADKQIINTPASFKCDVLPNTQLKQVLNSPENRPDCWQESITYNLNTYTLPYNKEVQLDDYFSIKWLGIQNYGTNLEQINSFILTKKKDLITIEPIKQENDAYFIIFGDKSETSYSIVNKYGNFEKSGVKVLRTDLLLTKQNSFQEDIKFKEGTNTYTIIRDTNKYGKVSELITPYYYIGDNLFFSSAQLNNNYEIVESVPENITLTQEEIMINTVNETGNSIKIWAISLIIFFIIIVFTIFKLKK